MLAGGRWVVDGGCMMMGDGDLVIVGWCMTIDD